MKVNGYKLREALRKQNSQRDIAAGLFDGSLHTFDDESKPHPTSVMAKFIIADKRIALLQVAQDMYNQHVEVNIDGAVMLLATAVKLVGGAGRAEKMWRTALGTKKDRYTHTNDNVRSTNEVRAKATMNQMEVLGHVDRAARFATLLRQAIAIGNAQEVDINLPGLEPELFE